jgi:phosphoglycerate dehydrogenase-like enzyme
MVNIAVIDDRQHLLVYEAEYPADLPFYRAQLHTRFPGLRIDVAASLEQALPHLPTITGLVAKSISVPEPLLVQAPRLQWIQALTTGVDRLLSMPLRKDIVLCSARGVHGPQMSELALLLMLSLARDFPRMVRHQQAALWQRWPQRLLRDRTVGIVGVGSISRELARCCQALGMRVVGVSNAIRSAEHYHEIQPRSALAAVAAQCDFMVLLVPYSPETHHLVDAHILRSLKSGAYLVNIARGPVVDEAALIEALRTGTLAGAGLDVFDAEPLPATSPLWQLPNVIITPHIGGTSDCYAQQLLPLILHNVGAWLAGEPAAMRNVVPH